MELSGWVMLAILFWVIGYVRSKFGKAADGELLLIFAWAYIAIGGFPLSKDLPQNTILVTGLRFQIAGWLMILYALFIYCAFT